MNAVERFASAVRRTVAAMRPGAWVSDTHTEPDGLAWALDAQRQSERA